MRDKGFDQLPVLAPKSRKLVGLVTLGNLLSWISQGRASASSPVSAVMFSFSKITEVVTDPRDFGAISPVAGKGEKMTNGEADSHGVAGSGEGKGKQFVEITVDTPLKALSRFFEWNSAAVVTEKSNDGVMKPVAVVTKVDLLTWLVKQGKIEG